MLEGRGKEEGEGGGEGKGERGRGTFMDSTSYDQLLHRSVPPPRPPPPLNKTGRIDKYLHLHFLFDIHCKRKRPINTICLNYGPTKGRNEGRGRL